MADVDESLSVLSQEFEAADGTFLLKLRSYVWDREAFTRLELALRVVAADYAERQKGSDSLPRWLAEGYYFVSHVVAETSLHPNFRRPEPREYYEACLERLRNLTDWFFQGESDFDESHVWVTL